MTETGQIIHVTDDDFAANVEQAKGLVLVALTAIDAPRIRHARFDLNKIGTKLFKLTQQIRK